MTTLPETENNDVFNSFQADFAPKDRQNPSGFECSMFRKGKCVPQTFLQAMTRFLQVVNQIEKFDWFISVTPPNHSRSGKQEHMLEMSLVSKWPVSSCANRITLCMTALTLAAAASPWDPWLHLERIRSTRHERHSAHINSPYSRDRTSGCLVLTRP